MLVVVANHNHNQQAIRLRNAFSTTGPTALIDSGSELSEHDKNCIDVLLPNVYYTGLLNEACCHLQKVATEDLLLFVSSDVEIDDPADLVKRAEHSFEDRRVGVYAPSMQASHHLHMRTAKGRGRRTVPFVEGVVFAVRKVLIEKLCPVDPSVNLLGWALDVHLGFLTLKSGFRSIVDDSIQIRHRPGRGYLDSEARSQAEEWINLQGSDAHTFWRRSTQQKYQTTFGFWKTRIRCRLF